MIAKVAACLLIVGSALAYPRPEDIPAYGPPLKHQLKQQEPVYKQHAQPSFRQHVDPYKHSDPYKQEEVKRPYQFDYGVRDDYTGTQFGHQENSDGNNIQGSYSVALPDGRIQTVKYIADHHNGFQAEVTYEGEAKYPEHIPQKYETHESSYEPLPKYKSHKAVAQYSEPEASYYPSPRYKSESNVYSDDEQQDTSNY